MDRMLRPKMKVLPDEALVKATHTVAREQPFYLGKPGKGAEPAGSFAAGAKVSLVSASRGPMCVVLDRQGRKVYTAREGLRPVTGK
jgi:hypothetical protein